jgi:hypothetical protein
MQEPGILLHYCPRVFVRVRDRTGLLLLAYALLCLWFISSQPHSKSTSSLFGRRDATLNAIDVYQRVYYLGEKKPSLRR